METTPLPTIVSKAMLVNHFRLTDGSCSHRKLRTKIFTDDKLSAIGMDRATFLARRDFNADETARIYKEFGITHLLQ